MKSFVSTIIVFALVLNSVAAFAGDVTSLNPNETFFVKVQKNADRYSFYLCGKSVVNNCAPIGRDEGYTQAQLTQASKALKMRGYGRIAGAIAIGAGVAIVVGVGVNVGAIPVGIVTLGTVGVAASNPVSAAFGIVAWLGIHGTWVGAVAAKMLHPMRAMKEAREIQDAISSGDYQVKSIADFAGDLAEGLAAVK